MKPSVSVVIPAYNHAAFIGESIQSVLDQSYDDLEIVITDDGSSDGTSDVVRRFTDPRIDLEIFDENQGASAALNSAVRRARGEFVCMLASDDYFLPGKLDKQVQFLRANPQIAAVFGMPRFIDERGFSLAHTYNGDVFAAPFAKQLRSRHDWLRYFFFEGNCLCHPTAMVRRSVYDEVGAFDPRLAGLPDFDMWIRLCMVHDIHVMPDELTAMRILDDNRNMSAPRNDSMLRSVVEYFQILKHYRRLSRQALKEVFAQEIAAAGLDADGPPGLLLAEIALLGRHPPHKLFALDTMFEKTSTHDGNYRRLIALAGSIDVFALESVRSLPQLYEQLNAAHAETALMRSAFSESEERAAVVQAEVARLTAALESKQQVTVRLNDELAAARAEAGQFQDALEIAHAEAVRLQAALDATRAESWRLNETLEASYAKAASLGAQLHAAHNKIADLTSVLETIGSRLNAIITRSRIYKLARRSKGLRPAIDQIADEAARALNRRWRSTR